MQLLEFGQRFLNYKAMVRIVNNHNGSTEFAGMFMDAPYRLLRFADVVRPEVDRELGVLILYITSNNKMFFQRESHFILESPSIEISY